MHTHNSPHLESGAEELLILSWSEIHGGTPKKKMERSLGEVLFHHKNTYLYILYT